MNWFVMLKEEKRERWGRERDRGGEKAWGKERGGGGRDRRRANRVQVL